MEDSRRITDDRSAMSKVWNRECFQEGLVQGVKYGTIISAVTGISLFAASRKVPWVQKNIKYQGHAFLTSSAFIAGLVINMEKKAFACEKRKQDLERSLKKTRRLG